MLFLRVAIAALWVILASRSAGAEDTDHSLLDYAVSINQSGQSRSGTGVYFGDGLVLTASHVVGDSLLHGPSVTIAGQQLPARIVKRESFEESDLALLSIDQQQLPAHLRQRKLSLCQTPPWPDEDVIVVVPEEAVHSHVISPLWLPRHVRQYDTVINDVAKTGNSGSAIFDAQKKCLLGIMSRKISQSFTSKDTGETATVDIAKYFVSAAKIEKFLPAEILEASRRADDSAAPPRQ